MSITRRSFLAAAACAAANPALAADAFVRVSPRNPRYLELSDGSPYVPIGLNLIAPSQRDEAAGLRQYEGWLDQLSAQGGNYVRVWLSNDFWDVEHAKSGEYDEAKARRIEAMLEMARRRGIRVKMTLEHFRSIGEGPQKWADKPIHHVSNGGPASSIADFFDGEKSREQFKRKLAWFAKRFGDRPEIFGWELWNEINAVRGGDYMAWTEIMLAELHKLFPRNLCLQSLGSFDTDRVRPVYRRHSLLATNDIAQVHRYLDLGAALEICHGPVDMLAADAVHELRSYEVSKPVILAESGAVEPRHTGPFKLYAADKEGTLLHDVLFAPFFAGSAGCGQIWHWDAYVERNNLWWHFGRFAEFVKGLDPAAEAFLTSFQPHPRLRVYRLDGRHTTLLWCRDTRNDWRSELERAEPPEKLAGLTLEEPSGREPVRVYNPWSGTWEQIRRTGGRLTLPDFQRSIALRLG
ncbi:MAG: cellulase family glycosylhydrolase [Bryobacteraceae bacterium]|nr:cellulase family glycosylhydrolase [Bryobacteraceae bacterium]